MTRPTISSTPVLTAVVRWGSIVGGGLVMLAALVGALIAGGQGAASGGLGALAGIVFPLLTAGSMLLANRWYGSPSYLQIFFGVVLGGWLVKFVLFLVALLVLARLPWVVPLVFFFALLASAVAALVIDLVVLSRVRVPTVSDDILPTEQSEADAESGQ